MGEPQEPQRQVAIITGGSRGLGRALATELARRGWALVLDARRVHELDAAAAELARRHRRRRVPGDVTDPGAPRPRSSQAATELGPRPLVVNNASTLGHSPLPRLDELDPGVLRDVFDDNVVAPVALVQARARRTSPTARTVREHHVRRGRRGLRGLGRLRLVQGRARARQPRPRRRASRPPRARRRPRRHAHRDAPGRVPGRGHLRPARARGERPRALALLGPRPAERPLRGPRPSPSEGRHVMLVTSPHPRLRRSTRPTRRTSRPRPAACAATTSGCSSRRATADPGRHPLREPRRLPRPRRPRRGQHLGDLPGGARRSPARRRAGRRPPLGRAGRRRRGSSRSAQPAAGATAPLRPRRRRRHRPVRRRDGSGSSRRSPTRGGSGWPHLDVPGSPLAYAARFGRPIRYRHVRRDWPLGFYQSVFSRRARAAPRCRARPALHRRLVADLDPARGPDHPAAPRTPACRPWRAASARTPSATGAAARPRPTVNATRADGGRVIARRHHRRARPRRPSPTTDGRVHPGCGWTERGRQRPTRRCRPSMVC